MYEVAIIGGGIGGMATAARLQRRGLSTIVLEAHGQPGGCAGYFRRRGFSFDVGATTLVDFEGNGVGAELLHDIRLSLLDSESIPGYVAWLPDRTIILHRDHQAWTCERLRMLGNTPEHQQFWKLIDRIATVFWNVSRRGAKLPCQGFGDLARDIHLIGLANVPIVRFLRWTLGDALRRYRLRHDRPLCGLLSMLVEDTVHSSIDRAPLINAALGITIRGAGLLRVKGGMRRFWQQFVENYKRLGGHLRVGCTVHNVKGCCGRYEIHTQHRILKACQVVSAVPVSLTSQIAGSIVGERLAAYLRRDSDALGGALVAFLGVPEEQLSGQAFDHHQLLHDYDAPLGNGNNLFISVSSPLDTASAPPGYRSVMISTHCELDHWKGLTPYQYKRQKAAAGERLVGLARRVYPNLGKASVVYEIATPHTFERFTHRPRGAVGGVRQSLKNTNQNAVPHDLGIPGFFLVGDTTWPGLGTVACVLGSRVVAEQVIAQYERKSTTIK